MRADELLESGDLPGDAVDSAQQDQVAGVREAFEAPQALGRSRTVVGQGVAAIGLARGQVEPALRPEDQRMTSSGPDEERSDPRVTRQAIRARPSALSTVGLPHPKIVVTMRPMAATPMTIVGQVGVSSRL